jgi:hypothetical protein
MAIAAKRVSANITTHMLTMPFDTLAKVCDKPPQWSHLAGLSRDDQRAL